MSGLNLLVFRGDRRRASGKELKAALIAQLEQLRGRFSYQALWVLSLLAGELECGVADTDARSCAFLLSYSLTKLRMRYSLANGRVNLTPIFKTSLFNHCSMLRGPFPLLSNSVSPLLKVLLITRFILWLMRMSYRRFLCAIICWLWGSGASAQP